MEFNEKLQQLSGIHRLTDIVGGVIFSAYYFYNLYKSQLHLL